MVTVDLKKLTKGEVRMLTGHPRGLAARDLFQLDSVVTSSEPVEIVAPGELDTITPSFLQGFLAKTLDQLGTDAFVSRLRLSALPAHLRRDFETGIRRLLIRRGEDPERALSKIH